jgi:hypothetical protein
MRGFIIAIMSVLATGCAAQQLEFFSIQPGNDPGCSGADTVVFSTTNVGPVGCVNLIPSADCFVYISEGNLLQLFAQENCGPAFFQSTLSTDGIIPIGEEAVSFAIITP